MHINDDHFPVSLALIEQSHDTENLNLLNLTDVADLFTDLTDIQRVVVTLGFCLRVESSRVLPCLAMINDAQRTEQG